MSHTRSTGWDSTGIAVSLGRRKAPHPGLNCPRRSNAGHVRNTASRRRYRPGFGVPASGPEMEPKARNTDPAIPYVLRQHQQLEHPRSSQRRHRPTRCPRIHKSPCSGQGPSALHDGNSRRPCLRHTSTPQGISSCACSSRDQPHRQPPRTGLISSPKGARLRHWVTSRGRTWAGYQRHPAPSGDAGHPGPGYPGSHC